MGHQKANQGINCKFSFLFCRKRAESEARKGSLPNSKEMPLHHPTDPVELRRLNFQTPGRYSPWSRRSPSLWIHCCLEKMHVNATDCSLKGLIYIHTVAWEPPLVLVICNRWRRLASDTMTTQEVSESFAARLCVKRVSSLQVDAGTGAYRSRRGSNLTVFLPGDAAQQKNEAVGMQAWRFPGSCRLPVHLQYWGHRDAPSLLINRIVLRGQHPAS